ENVLAQFGGERRNRRRFDARRQPRAAFLLHDQIVQLIGCEAFLVYAQTGTIGDCDAAQSNAEVVTEPRFLADDLPCECAADLAEAEERERRFVTIAATQRAELLELK